MAMDVFKSFRSFSGFAYGRMLHFRERQPLHAYEGKLNALPSGEDSFLRSVREVESHFLTIRRSLQHQWNEPATRIFEGHLMLIRDPVFQGRVLERIRGGKPTAKALVEVVRETMGLLGSSQSQRLQEKAQDLEDLGLYLLEQLSGDSHRRHIQRKKIVVGSVFYPSDIFALASKGVKGLVIVGDGLSSHGAILAQSMGIPVFMTHDRKFLGLKENTSLFMNPMSKTIHVDPSMAFFKQLRRELFLRWSESSDGTSAPSTKKGTPFSLMANINLMKDFDLALEVGADGVGLYRSEFAFMVGNRMPSEAEQVNIYRRFFGPMKQRPITIRTFDLGGDKPLQSYSKEHIGSTVDFRLDPLSTHHKNLLGVQLRAILRAGANHPLHILFPMVSSPAVLEAYIDLLDRAVESLMRANIDFNQSPKIGSMIELPSIIPAIESLKGKVDFLSIGTNDLTEHALMGQRKDKNFEQKASPSIPHDPLVLGLLEQAVSSAIRAGLPISICGDMAENELYTPFLVGIGLRTFSMNPKGLPNIRRAIASLDVGEAKLQAKALLGKKSIEDIESILGVERKPVGAL